jgi:hypothetical protein
MAPVVELKAMQSRQNKTDRQHIVDEFRGDVLTYSVMLYDSLRKRRDFCAVGAPSGSEGKRHHVEECD